MIDKTLVAAIAAMASDLTNEERIAVCEKIANMVPDTHRWLLLVRLRAIATGRALRHGKRRVAA